MNKMPSFKMWILATIAVLLIWCGYWYALTKWGNMTTRGQFGDMFGALNTLFAGLGFAGLVFTILSQQAQIKEGREEQHRDREMQGKQMELMNKQVEALQQQLSLLQDSGRPVIKFHEASAFDLPNTKNALRVSFKNVGVPFQMSRIDVSELEDPGEVIQPEGVLVSDQYFDIKFTREAGSRTAGQLPRNFRFTVHYITSSRIRGQLSFRLNDCTPILELEGS